jgi:hypothetical protein
MKLFHFLFGTWPKLQMLRRGYQFVIVDRLGRTVARSKGALGIQFAWDELHRPPTEPSPKEEWQLRIERANSKCAEWSVKLKEGKVA